MTILVCCMPSPCAMFLTTPISNDWLFGIFLSIYCEFVGFEMSRVAHTAVY